MEDDRLDNKLSDDIETFENCTDAFKRLKIVVSQWLTDVKSRKNMFADVLLAHLYRWLSSGEAKLYDPQLFSFVNNLMQKCFTELIKKFQALGATLIFTSFNKIIIETKRNDIEQARNYVKFVIDTIMKESMFKFLRMSPCEEWKILLFKDRFNYGGMAEGEKTLVKCEFDLKKHLPEKVSIYFLTMIGEFIRRNEAYIREKKNKVLHDDPSVHLDMNLVGLPKEAMDPDDIDPYVGPEAACNSMAHLDLVADLAEMEDITFCRNLLKKDFTKRMFEVIDEIKDNKNIAESQFKEAEREIDYISTEEYEELKEERDSWNFKPRLGSYLETTNPQFELIKFLCKMFSLEEALGGTVNLIKKG